MALLLCITCVPCLACVSGGETEAIPSPEEAIGFLETYYGQFPWFCVLVEEVRVVDPSTTDYYMDYNASFKLAYDWRFCRKDTSWTILYSSRVTFYDEMKKQYCTAFNKGQYISTSKQAFHYALPEDGKPVLAMSGCLTGRTVIEWCPNADFVQVFSSYFPRNANIPLPDILRQSRLSVRRGTYEGQPALVIEGESDYGLHTVYLDVSRKYMPRRISQHKRARDRLNEHLVSSWELRGSPRQDMYYDLEITEVDKKDGRHVPVKARVKDKDVYANGYVMAMIAEFKFSQWEFDKDVSFEPDIPIPDGTPVTVFGESHIDYEWRGGQIVKRIPQGTIRSLLGRWFRPGSLIGTSTLILLLLTLAGGVFYVWYRRKVAGKSI